ncbi:unnamed protein product [Urochloa humidicola]
MIIGSARNISTSGRQRRQQGATNKKSKEAESSKRRRKESSSENEDDPNDSDYIGENEVESSMGRYTAGFIVDEDEVMHEPGSGSTDDIIDTFAYTAPKKVWDSAEYARLRNDYAYGRIRDTNNLYFHTIVQEDAFFGHLLQTNVFIHKRVDFPYLAQKPVLEDLDEKKLEWMTGKKRYAATFEEFATVNQLDYAYFTDANDSINVYNQDVVEDIHIFYEPGHTGIKVEHGTPVGLRHHPAAINNIIRSTLMPKTGNRGSILEYYWNVISYIRNGQRFNVVSLIFEQMIEKKRSLGGNMYFAPYIMTLIKAKINFDGPCDVYHSLYQPFLNASTFLKRPLTPPEALQPNFQPLGVEVAEENVAGTHEMPPPAPMQPQWAPPPGFFDPYFVSLQQGFNTQFAALSDQIDTNLHNMQQGFQGQLSAGFESFGQHLHSTMYEPIMMSLQNVEKSIHTQIDALNDRFKDLSTSQQYQQLVDRQQRLETDFGTFSTAFTGFTDHFYSLYPAPAQQPYHPPLPPPQDDDHA